MYRFFISVILLLMPLISIGQETRSFAYLSPDMKPSYQPQEEVEAGFWMSVDKIENKLKNSPSLISDPDINQYLNGMVCKLAGEYCDDIRVYIVRQPYFNASMYPNGMMVVWTGLLLRVENEDQLAAILGHEIGHYLKRHMIKRHIDLKEKASSNAFLSIGLAMTGFGILTLATNEILVNSIYANSRANEHEADRYGVQLMKQAGYDLHQAPLIWKNLINEEEAARKKDEKDKAVFLTTHPSPESRFENLQKYAQQLQNKEQLDLNRNQLYQKLIKRHIYSFLNDQMLLNEPEKTEYLLNELMNKGQNLGVVNYYKGELFRMTKNTPHLKDAENAYLQALKYEDAPVQTYRDLGIVLLKQSKVPEAKIRFQQYLDLNLEAKDRDMIEYYLSMEI
jgi:predicted Zn-dependent protease